MTSEDEKLILKYISLRNVFDDFQREENRAVQALFLKFVIKFFGALIALVLSYNSLLQLSSYFFIYLTILLLNIFFCQQLVKAYLTRNEDLKTLFKDLLTESFEKCIDDLKLDESLKVLIKPLLKQKFSMRYDFSVKQPQAVLDSMIFIVFLQFLMHFYAIDQDVSVPATSMIVFLIFVLTSTALDYLTFRQWRENDFNPSEKKLKRSSEEINDLVIKAKSSGEKKSNQK